MNKNLLKSITAIFAGLILIFVLSVATDHLLENKGLMKLMPLAFNPWWIVLIVIVSRCIYTVSGSFICSKMAPNHRLRHAMIIGIIGFVIGMSGTIVMWDQAPHWFSLVLTFIPLPSAWIGGKIG